jgi:MSHA biogenesis protein MshQ
MNISTTATYSEVGAFTLQIQDTSFASVDAAANFGAGDGTSADCSGQYVCSSVIVGRFVPDHFAVSGGSLVNRSDICPLGTNCPSSFTYLGEPMNAVFKLTAQAAGGSTTQNYTGSLAKLNPQAAVTAYTGGPLGLGVIDTTAPRIPFLVCMATPAHPCFTPLVASGSFASGAANITVPLTVYRGATAVGPFAALNIGIAPLDSDGVTSVYNLDTTNVVAGASDHTNLLVTGNLLYGRLNISNAHGSELLQLPIAVTVQYWNGTSYLTNTQDSATTLSASTASSANWTNITPGNWQKLNATSTWPAGATSVVPSTAAMAFRSGKSSFTLTAPGTGITGSVDMIINSSIAPTYLPSNTAARATFGVYKGANGLIYLRENY